MCFKKMSKMADYRNLLSSFLAVFDYGDLYNAASNPPRIGLYSTTPQGSNT